MQVKLSRASQWLVIIMLLLALVVIMIFSVTQGSVKIPVAQVLEIIHAHLWGTQLSGIDEANNFIVLQVRLPRILLAAMVGSTLAVSGTAFQAIFRNPMADPYVMGVSSGAAFGATLGIVFGLGTSLFSMSAVSVMAFAGAIVTVFLVYELARTGGKVATMNILLAGIVVNAILSALISLIMILFHNDIDQIVIWTMGSLNAATWEQVKLLIIPMLLGSIWLMAQSRELNALLLGEEEAVNMGIPVDRIKRRVLVGVSFLAACAVSVSGIIGFVGLIVPHLFRLIFGSNHKLLIPASVLGGASFLLICDTVARSLVPNMEVPVGIVTAILGGPFFLILLQNHKRKMM